MTMMDNIITFLMIMSAWTLGLMGAWILFDKVYPEKEVKRKEVKRRGF